MDQLAEEVSEYGTIEQSPKIEGGSMTMVLAPIRQSKGSVGGQQKDEEE
jgi:translation initiation factor IF-3